MNRWNRLADRTPPEDGKYLVFCPSADPDEPLIATAWWHGDAIRWTLLPEVWLGAITHWMPLPDPPAGD